MKKTFIAIAVLSCLAFATAFSQTAVFTIAGTPTFTITPINDTSYYYTADFNVTIKAEGGDVVINTMSSVSPSFTPALFTLYRNGVSYDPPTVMVSYAAPSSGVTYEGSGFKISENNQVAVPVTYFFIPSAGASAYGVEFAKASWIANGEVHTVDLGGPSWSAGSVPSSVPEPSTYALWAGVAGIGIVLWTRSRAKTA